MDKLHKGWFTEFSPDDLEKMSNPDAPEDSSSKLLKSDGQEMGGAWPGQAFSLQVKKVLFHEKSKYQDVLVFESTTYGNVLVLDGIVQATERDEFSYQEMLAHLPLFAHQNPKKVLIIGGGDGGILREVLKHDTVEKVTMCEIDEMVIDVAKKFLPGMSCGFSHEKLDLYCGDGFEFLKNHKNEFDVIITDSSDPVGPAESLFGQSYYELLRDALKEDGILSSQGESVWLHLPLIAHLVAFNRKIFPTVNYAQSIVSTYPSGSMGYLICAKSDTRDVTTPARVLSDEQVKNMNLRFYNSEVHKAAFVLPQFVRNALEKKKE
ncbi:Protein CBR-SPDS-1 [Caenorhabditis briggsae]|uniref:PABS domain-containing protein n=2 Tax=Caenorhabditis briggsae TaxID=6238 RepID=A0AAE9DQU3_CAEBR|nr:Protein CBR-SPDS-1 [Caenorhabditis briggsae]ULU08282.1 hypothetical protein L3Y34_019438 [Caenorhabditis briggsae]UMM20208.1 hypothetical protein L5515_015550 [Caenorhabditis briggsae]CAP27827.2 Protein CBR-SPDS-1 [Caenorhabditis briggsae]